MLFVVSIGHGVKYSRMNITQQGISHIPFTCSYRYTRSPVEDVILCDQEPRCIALYKKWEADGTRVHQTCSCAIHPGNSTLSGVETKHIFMSIRRGKCHPGKLLNTWRHEHILQKHFPISSIAQSVCQRAFSLLAIWCLRPWVQIVHSAEEDNLSRFDYKIACLCQSIKINNNKHINMCIYTI